jgi:cardiolipin synthase
LIRKSRSGVAIYLLYDDVGSSRITKAYVQDLAASGVHVTGMKTTRGWGNRFQLNFRNHRKIVVVDGRVAFVGGHNVGDEYMGKHAKLTPWRDTHLAFSGPAVLSAQLTFVEDWYWATEQIPKIRWQPQPSEKSNRTIFVLPSGPADEFETCGLFFMHAINSAKERIWIATPYFVPDEGIITALQLAALRGVEVRILIPGLPDKPMIKMAAMTYVPQVTEAGVEMYEYGEGFMHQKVVLVDQGLAAVGTANFDNRSFRLNFEVTVLTIDNEFACEVEQMLKKDFAKSTRIDAADLASRPWWSKVGGKVARLFAPVL